MRARTVGQLIIALGIVGCASGPVTPSRIAAPGSTLTGSWAAPGQPELFTASDSGIRLVDGCRGAWTSSPVVVEFGGIFSFRASYFGGGPIRQGASTLVDVTGQVQGSSLSVRYKPVGDTTVTQTLSLESGVQPRFGFACPA